MDFGPISGTGARNRTLTGKSPKVPWRAVGNATEAAYLRSDEFELRRRAMVDWGAYVSMQFEENYSLTR